MHNLLSPLLIATLYILLNSCGENAALLEKSMGASMITAESSDLFDGMVYYDGSLYTGVRYRKSSQDKKVWEVEVQNGKYHGFYKEWYKNGNLKLRQAYNRNKRHGLNTLYWNTQDSLPLREKGVYKNDKKSGVWKYWYKNGALHYEENMKDGRRVLEGSIMFYYSNGKKKKELSYKNGSPHGMWRTWYENGTLKTEGEYKNGEEEGVFIVNFANGKLMRKENFLLSDDKLILLY